MTQGRSPLLKTDWRFIEKISLEDFGRADWDLLQGQRDVYYAEQQAIQVLRMLAASELDSSFGYLVNNYRHSLQSATMALRDGLAEEEIVVCLLHDIGFVTCPATHGEFAAELLGAYVSDRNYWMLQRHAIFQNVHSPQLPGVDHDEREKWRSHPHFEWAAEFVCKYDQAACDPNYECASLEVFEPMVKRLFSKKPVRRVLP